MANVISGDKGETKDGRRVNKRLYFDTTTDASIPGIQEIKGIFWTADSGSEIATDNDFLLSDSNGGIIIGKRAKAAGDDLGITLPKDDPLIVDGIVVTTMDGGVCNVWLAN